MTELKPCPFCGGKARLEIHCFAGLDNTYGIVCEDCAARSNQFFHMISQAVAAWNKRKKPKTAIDVHNKLIGSDSFRY